ncbi:MAG: glucoamylase family protein [Bacteroidales bacterium]|nr:glucoamylase family protein [Bacteroidales bacterium]
MRTKLVLSLFILLLVGCKNDPEPTIVVIKNDETYSPANVRPVLETWQHKNFDYFYDGASASTGMALEGNDRGDVVTIGGSGFGIMSIIVGAERGWITKAQAADRTLMMLHFLGKAERFKGMWSHWYNPDGTAHPFGDQVKTGDLVESAFLAAGLLTASEYYTANTPIETEIRDSVASFWNTMDWKFYAGLDDQLHWLWRSQTNILELGVSGWNECWIAYILALGAPTPHAISQATYQNGWQNNGSIFHANRSYYGYKLPFGEEKGGPMFFAHYSFLGLDSRKIEDQYASYWQQNVSHAMINRHYCLEDAPKSYLYDEKNWGLTACYGAKSPWDYKARSPLNDDGVIAPTAALGSYPYTPFYSTQVLLQLASNSLAQGSYGFADAYCPSTATSEKKQLAIDQGPIVVMIENYRSGLIWNLLMKNEHVKQGLQLAGVKASPNFAQGFPLAVTNTKTNEYDMMRHPDRGSYELDYFLNTGGNTRFTITNSAKTVVFEETINSQAGEHVWSFYDAKIQNGKQYTITMYAPDGKESHLVVRLR